MAAPGAIRLDRRHAITAFVDCHRYVWEGAMAALAVAYLTVGLLADERGSFLPVIVIGAIFFVEFSVRLWAAPSRPLYLRKHWIDAVSCLPMIGGLRHGINPNVHNFGDALYWALITTTTVGYGDVVPVTPEGRILAGALVFVGIGLVGFASGQITAGLLATRDDSSKVLEEVASMRSELHRMPELLIDREGRGEA